MRETNVMWRNETSVRINNYVDLFKGFNCPLSKLIPGLKKDINTLLHLLILYIIQLVLPFSRKCLFYSSKGLCPL